MLAPVEAHPFHTTTAEIEYNRQSGRFEVSLKVPAADLEEALTRETLQVAKAMQGGGGREATQTAGSLQRVTLAETPEVERLIVAYLKTHFFLTSQPVDAPAGADAEARADEVFDKPSSHASAGATRPDATEHHSRLHWLGMELDKSSTWLYFELEPPEGDKLSLGNELFMELNPQQINTCTLRTAATKFSLRTDARHPEVALPPQARLR